jgi:hypothetical protein
MLQRRESPILAAMKTRMEIICLERWGWLPTPNSDLSWTATRNIEYRLNVDPETAHPSSPGPHLRLAYAFQEASSVLT